MNIDTYKVPFSAFGSYLAISRHMGDCGLDQGLYIKNIRSNFSKSFLFKLDLIYEGKVMTFEEITTPSKQRLLCDKGYVDICFDQKDCIRFCGHGVGLRLSHSLPGIFTYAVQRDKNILEFNSCESATMSALVVLKGELSVNAPWISRNDIQAWEALRCSVIIADFLPQSSYDSFEGVVEVFKNVYNIHEYLDFNQCVKNNQNSYETWLKKSIQTSPIYNETQMLAAYVNWSSVVSPEGNLKRHAMFMSKNHMTRIWSWDNCFNAMASAPGNIELAIDQLMLFFDHQDESGCIPDSMNTTSMELCFCKPPIQGWALNWMLNHGASITNDHLLKFYTPLSKLTNWWFNYRDYDNDGIPQYNHGNDSGWDNCTVFDKGVPLESPDLPAFLIIQMEVLSQIAERLKIPNDVVMWKNKAHKLLKLFLSHSWEKEKFRVYKSGNHKSEEFSGDSLINFIPLILGKRLPQDIRSSLVQGLTNKDRFITPYGLATESISSPLYLEEGYWRGPIWAPPTMLIVDGLYNSGEVKLAAELSKTFCNTVAKEGMAENFSAKRGVGLCDKAYTWTASIFSILAGYYL